MGDLVPCCLCLAVSQCHVCTGRGHIPCLFACLLVCLICVAIGEKDVYPRACPLGRLGEQSMWRRIGIGFLGLLPDVACSCLAYLFPPCQHEGFAASTEEEQLRPRVI